MISLEGDSDTDKRFEHAYTSESLSTVYQLRAESDSDTEQKIRHAYTSETMSTSMGHIFEDPLIAKHYAEKYEEAKYEGRHHFDPGLTWTPKEYKTLLRKTDLYATLFAFVMFFALDIDRYNMSNAVSGTLLEDIKLTTNDYNLSNTINLVCFMVAEIPSQLLSKKVGPNRWMPIQMMAWSIMATCQCLIQSKTQYLVMRGCLGFLEGGFIPCMCLWLTYFYPNTEIATRIGYFYLANPITSAVSSLLAYGILHLHGAHGWSGWRYLLLIEGLFTIAVSCTAFFAMPSSAVQTKTSWRPKGWYTDREERILVNALLRDDPHKGANSNREGLSVRKVAEAIGDVYMWPMYISRLLLDITCQPVKTYLPIILKSMGFTTFTINLLMIPYNIGTIITMQTQTHVSGYIEEVGLPLSMSALWPVPCIAAMILWKGFLKDYWASYALITVALAYPPSSPLSVAWVSRNSNSLATRTLTLPLVNCFGQLACIISANILRMDDAPRYERGLTHLLAIGISAAVWTLGTRALYGFINKRRDKKWKLMTAEEQSAYTTSTCDKGNRRLDFRFSL